MSIEKRINSHNRLTTLQGQKTSVNASHNSLYTRSTGVKIRWKEDTEVTILIHNTAGHLVRKLDLGYKQAGFYISKNRAARWNGRSEADEELSNGVYFYTIKADHYTATRRMVIAR